MAALIAALVNHPRVIAVVACILLIALGGLSLYRAGESAATRTIRTAQIRAAAKSDSALATALGATLTVRRENDSLRLRSDSLTRVVAEKRTSASLVKSRLVLHGDTARVATDTGVVAVPIPEVLTRELAAMRLNNDSLVIALDRRHDADSTLVHGLTVQIQLDSTMQSEYRKQLAGAESRIAADEAKPQHSRLVWFLAGVGTTALTVAVAAVAF